MKVEIKKHPKFEPVKMEITIDNELDYDSMLAAIHEYEMDGVVADNFTTQEFHEDLIRSISAALDAAKSAR